MGKLRTRGIIKMKWPKFLTLLGLLMILAIAPACFDQCCAESDAATGKSGAVTERLRERAESVQERRKGRVTQAQRQAAADRAELARTKSVVDKNIGRDRGKRGPQ